MLQLHAEEIKLQHVTIDANQPHHSLLHHNQLLLVIVKGKQEHNVEQDQPKRQLNAETEHLTHVKLLAEDQHHNHQPLLMLVIAKLLLFKDVDPLELPDKPNAETTKLLHVKEDVLHLNHQEFHQVHVIAKLNPYLNAVPVLLLNLQLAETTKLQHVT